MGSWFERFLFYFSMWGPTYYACQIESIPLYHGVCPALYIHRFSITKVEKTGLFLQQVNNEEWFYLGLRHRIITKR